MTDGKAVRYAALSVRMRLGRHQDTLSSAPGGDKIPGSVTGRKGKRSMHDLLIWLVGSVALFAVGSNVAWSLDRPGGPPRPWLRRPWTDLVRAAYCVGIPALAIALKVPAASGMGLPRQIDGVWTDGGPHAWPLDLLTVLGLAAMTAGLIVFGRVWRARARGDALSPRFVSLPAATLIGLAERGLLQESHWAFYRAGLIASGLASRDLAVFLSLLVLAMEAWSSPALRLAEDPNGAAERFSQQIILATLSASLFLATGSSLWAFMGQLTTLLLLAATDMDQTDLPARSNQDRRAAPVSAFGAATVPTAPLRVSPPPRSAAEAERIEPTVL